MTIDEDMSASGGTDEEILALVADDRVMGQDRLIAEEADIAFLGAPDNRDVLDQRVFAPLAGVAALRAHHHQPSAFEQFADETDKEADQRADQDDRDGAAKGLRESRGERLVAEAAGGAADQTADCAIAAACARTRRPADA